MSENTEKISFKGVLFYFGKIQLCVLVSLIISLPLLILIRFFTDNKILENLIFGILGLVIEFSVLLFTFSREKINDKLLNCSFVIKTTLLALIPHFILSLCFKFYMYIAGVGVSSLGLFWGSMVANMYLKEHSAVPLYMYIALMIPMMALIVLSSYLGFKLGDKKIQKEREMLLKK